MGKLHSLALILVSLTTLTRGDTITGNGTEPQNKLPPMGTNHVGSESMVSSLYDILNADPSSRPHDTQSNPRVTPKQQIQTERLETSQVGYPESAAIALGSNEVIQGYPQMNTMPLEAQSLLIEPSQVYDRQMPVPPQEQVVARLYIDSMGNQYLQHPNPRAEPKAAPVRPRQQYAASDTYSSQQYPMNQNGQLANFYDASAPNQLLPEQMYQLNHDIATQQQPVAQNLPPKIGDPKPSAKLSNEQLVTLIDELKDFNDRQASKILARGTKPASEEESSDPDEEKEDSAEISAPESVRKPDMSLDEARKRTSVPDSSTQPTMSSEDLAKFAKFLMSKEGTNMRFQLGLDRDSPDDGDDEDRDSLLDSKAESRKSQGDNDSPPRELDKLDRKHSDVSINMDNLIDDLTKTTDSASVRATTRKPNREESDDLDETDPLSKFKRRRRHQSVELDNQNDRERSVEPKSNFAKMLIKQEMMQDKQDTDEKLSTSPASSSSTTDYIKPSEPKPKQQRSHQNGGGIQSDSGQATYKYPRPERNRDHIGLIHELQKSREVRSKMSSRSPLKRNSLTQRALDGEMGLRTESEPDGNLIMRSNRDHLLTLKIPRNAVTTERPYSGSEKSQNRENSDAVGNSNGESGSKIKQISLSSGQPLKDEYPVSERVGERLNKLSRNLDRYFNDGFLQEVETKAKLRDDSDKDKPIAQSSKRVQTEDHSAKRELPDSNSAVSGIKADQDFDVDVGIDGRRDMDKEYDGDGDEDGESGRDTKKIHSEELKRPRSRPRPIGSSVTKGKKKQSEHQARISHRKRGLGHQVEAIRLAGDHEPQAEDPKDDQTEGGTVSTRLAAGKENIEFENAARILPNLDPVDSETLDTPIGPDRDNMMYPNLNKSDNKVQNSKTSDEVTAKYGKRVNGKFYEEPEWNR